MNTRYIYYTVGGSATVTVATSVINDSQFYVTTDTSILQGSGTYTFTAP